MPIAAVGLALEAIEEGDTGSAYFADFKRRFTVIALEDISERSQVIVVDANNGVIEYPQYTKITEGQGLIRDTIESYSSLDPSERSRRQLFWRDDMENYTTCKWTGVAGGTPSYVNSVRAFEGDYVLDLRNPTGTFFGAYVRFGRFKDGIHAFEIRWFKDSHLDNFYIEFGVTNLLGVFRVGTIQYVAVEGKWRYKDADGNLQDITGGYDPIYNDTWCYLKIVLDWANNRYHRLVTNGLNIDLSGLNLALQQISEYGIASLVNIYVTVDAADTPIYFDDARVYLNEEE